MPQGPPFGPPSLDGSPPSDADLLQQALAGLSGQGADVLQFLRPDDAPSDASPGPVPASGPGTLYDTLSEEELDLLATELTELRDDYQTSCRDFFDIEQEIRDAYAMRADSTHSGAGVEASQMVSELTMNLTDQVVARQNANILGVTPLVRVEPVALSDQDDARTKDLLDSARATENFIHAYSHEQLGVERKIPLTNLRTVKLGTTVIYVEWVEELKKTKHYTAEHTEAQQSEDRAGRLVWNLVPNRHVIVWPYTIENWQEEYEVVGHDMYLSPARWRELCNQLGISDENRDLALRVNAGADDEFKEENLAAQGMDTGPVRDRLSAEVVITNLFCYRPLPGRHGRERFQVLLDPNNRKVVWCDENRWHTCKHGYFPIRYKAIDEFAWGMGLGHEVVYHQAADSTFRNIQIDNLMALCYYVIGMKPDLMHEFLNDRPNPGQVLPLDNPKEDVQSIKLGGEVPELLSAMTDNQNRARTAAGIPPVLSGMGDPVQKSGTGSGATQALIEQGGQKIGDVDRQMRLDYSDLFQFTLEALAQCAPDGVLYRFAPDKDVPLLKELRWKAPRGQIERLFRVSAVAPNANTSYEARQRSWLLMWQFFKDFNQTVLPQAIQLLQSENPGAIPRLQRQAIEAAIFMVKRVCEDYQIPGALQQVWDFPEPLPQDQTIANYVQHINDLQQQLQQKQASDKPKEAISIDKIPPPGMANLGQVAMLHQAGIDYPPPDQGQGATPGAPPGMPPGAPQPQPSGGPSPGPM